MGIRSSGHLRYEDQRLFEKLTQLHAHPTELVTFDLLRLPSPESSLVDQVRQLLLHELFDTLYGFL